MHSLASECSDWPFAVAHTVSRTLAGVKFELLRGETVKKQYVDQWLHFIKASDEYQRIVGRRLN